MATFWYLATPYSKYAEGIEAAHRHACEQAALLVKAGIPVYAPIAHTHPIAIHGQLDPKDLDTWLRVDRPFIDVACGIIVCQLPGWADSKGVEYEIREFDRAGKPVVFMEPNEVPALPPLPGDQDYLALLDELRELHIRKAKDYGSDADPLANLRGSEAIGVEAWRGAWMRKLDKVGRMNRYCIKGTLANEGVRDTLLDDAAYSLLTLRLWDEKHRKAEA